MVYLENPQVLAELIPMDYMQSELTPLQNLVFAYTMTSDRPLYRAVFALDNRCAQILRTTRESMLGQMRLAWWRDVMAKPADDRPRGDVVLDALTRLERESADLRGLHRVIDGWEELLVAQVWDAPVIARFADQRGSAVFSLLGPGISELGHSWALWDLARHSTDPVLHDDAMQLLRERSAAIQSAKLPRSQRAISILRVLMLDDIKRGDFNADLMRPGSAARIVWHGLTGW